MPTLRNDLRYRAAGWLGYALMQAERWTWSVRIRDESGVRSRFRSGGGGVAVFWHRQILPLMTTMCDLPLVVPVSRSPDGEFAAHAMERFGVVSVRGSSSRGRLALLKGLLEHMRRGYVAAITPDGPRGPRYTVQPGFALLARRAGCPVYPVGVGVRGALTMNSWDAFVVPLPFAQVGIALGHALYPRDYPETGDFCTALRRRLFAATAEARRMVGLPALPPIPPGP